ncbi:MAG: DinB family protein [Planctomycetaceae bacterium]|nr:DinB family protein [Planctomycetaceae bacterium]
MSNLELLLELLDQAFDHKSWHGPNLRGSIRGLSAEQAAWRAQPARKNIHEIVLHCAYWKYTVRRRLNGEKRGSFPLQGSNWFTRPLDDQIDIEVWKADVKLLAETHSSLRAEIAKLTTSQLSQKAPGASTTLLQLVTGIAAHDLYHAGQIQTIKRLFADAKSTN